MSFEENDFGVFISDIARGVTDTMLKEEFQKFGDVVEAVVVKNKHSGETKGYGFVKFASINDVRAAIDSNNPPIFKDQATGKSQVVKITLADSKNTLYIGNIPKGLLESEVKEKLEEIGETQMKHFYFEGGENRTHGYAQFRDHDATIKALKLIQKSSTFTASLTPSSQKKNTLDKQPSTKVLFIRGIKNQEEADQLRRQLGSDLIEKVIVPLDSQKKVPLGHAFIYCNTISDAKEIMSSYSTIDFQGKKLNITWGLPKQRKSDHPYYGGAPHLDYAYPYFPEYYYSQLPIVDPRRSGYGSPSAGASKKDIYSHAYHLPPPPAPGKYDYYYPPPPDRYGSGGNSKGHSHHSKPPPSSGKYRFSPY
ncbi:hypothetical protein CYY_001744 [Polysphondylium violaceum]|uniref:RRM domain-containing protein n=1 Tax=Polysphondylium violaceum TaxID=133409 RepID=A0A8J4PXU9_9MYCE|nr:hypothetical protein CYY_001744 [Polysphondylium violaceum]